MAFFEVPEDPEYEDQIRMFETSDRAHASLFNKVIQALINNIAFIKNKAGDRIVIGPRDTPLEPGTTLFVVEGMPLPQKFEGASFEDMFFSRDAPEAAAPGQAWAQFESDSQKLKAGENLSIINGKLVVSEEDPSGATFFAKIEK